MIEVLAPTLAALSAAVMVAWANRGKNRDLCQAVLDARKQRDAEAERVERLMALLMSREAPAEYAAYIDPPAPYIPAVPENAIWSDSGLFWAAPEDGD